MTGELPKISDAEWQVMKVAWEKYPLTSSEIIEALKSKTKWKPKTVHTLIGRLVEKRALEAVKKQGFYEYHPLVTKDECRRDETESFLQKVYDGSFALLLASFAREEKLSREEIQELKRILEENRGE